MTEAKTRAPKRKTQPAPALPSQATKPTSPRPVRSRTPMIREAALRQAAKFFAERGFEGTNLKDVAEALDISRPGLYYHFPTKERLLEALIEEVTVSNERQLAVIMAREEEDPVKAFRGLLTHVTEWLLDNVLLFRVVDRVEVEMPDGLRQRHEAAKRAILHHFTVVIKRGIEMGRFRPVDPEVAAFAIIGMRNWAAWWFKPDGRLSVRDVVETLVEMAMASLVRPDMHRSRSNRVTDALQILKDDVALLEQLVQRETPSQ